MTDTAVRLLEISGSLFEGFIVLFALLELPCERLSKKQKIFMLLFTDVIYTVCVSLLNAWQVFSFVTVAFAVMFSVLYSKLYSRLPLNVCCTSVLLVWFFMNGLDYIVLYAGLMITGKSLDVTQGFEYILQPTVYRYICLFADKLIQFLCAFFLRRHLRRLVALDRRTVNILMLTGLAAYVMLNLLTGLIAADSLFKMQFAVFLAFLLIMISVIVILFGVSMSEKAQREAHERDMILLANTFIEQQFRQYEKSQEKNRQLLHDFRNHLFTLNGLIGNDSAAKEYLDGLLNESKAAARKFNSGNNIIDAVINSKYETALEKGIEFTFSFRSDAVSKIRAVDICSILTNQIDNATEACEKLPEGREKRIDVSIRQREHFVIFKVDNTTADDPFIDNPALKTTKRNDQGIHGFGINSIKETAARYSGVVNNSYKYGVFTSLVMLQITD